MFALLQSVFLSTPAPSLVYSRFDAVTLPSPHRKHCLAAVILKLFWWLLLGSHSPSTAAAPVAAVAVVVAVAVAVAGKAALVCRAWSEERPRMTVARHSHRETSRICISAPHNGEFLASSSGCARGGVKKVGRQEKRWDGRPPGAS